MPDAGLLLIQLVLVDRKDAQDQAGGGQSVNFVLMICCGYVLGITSKIVAWQALGELSPLVWVYSWNFLVTAFDALLVVHYSRAERSPEPVFLVTGE